MAEKAAEAAALEAFQEAMMQGVDSQVEYGSGIFQTWTQEGTMDMYTSQLRVESDEMNLMQSLHLDNMESNQVEVLQGLLGFQQNNHTTDDATAQQLLLLLEQQQHQQHNASMSIGGEGFHASRPEKHYLTIAQNGEFFFLA